MTTSIITEMGSSSMPKSMCRSSVKRSHSKLIGIIDCHESAVLPMTKKYWYATLYASTAQNPIPKVPMIPAILGRSLPPTSPKNKKRNKGVIKIKILYSI